MSDKHECYLCGSGRHLAINCTRDEKIKSLTELLPKPKREDFVRIDYRNDRATERLNDFIEAERDYYKRLAEFAIEALEKIDVKASGGLCSFEFRSARLFLKDIREIKAAVLQSIKGSQHE